MSPQPQITFHDIPSTLQKTWSPFTARTLLCLHHLQLEYTHNLIPYPDISPTLQRLHVPPTPNTEGKRVRWTLPAISLTHPSGTKETIMDSGPIATKLSQLADSKLSATLFPQRVEEGVEELSMAIKEIMQQGFWKHVVPFVPRIMVQRSVEYFVETRTEALGDLEGLRKEALKKEREERGLRELVKGYLARFGEVYRRFDEEVEGGDFMFGAREPSYVDICFAAQIQWWVCSRDGDREEILGALDEVEGGRLGRVFRSFERVLDAKVAEFSG